ARRIQRGGRTPRGRWSSLSARGAMAEWGPFAALDNLSVDELRQRLQALQATITRAPIPIAIAHDADCRVITANRALASLLQTPPEANISLTPPPGLAPAYRIQRNGRDLP